MLFFFQFTVPGLRIALLKTKFAVLEVGVHIDKERTLCAYQNLMDENME